MHNYEQPEFSTTTIDAITTTVAEFKRSGYRFVQLCASTLEDSCDLLYAFVDPEKETPGMVGVIVNVPDGEHVPSITDFYPAAFVFENETHDLFGIDFDGINIDFGGDFYSVAVAYPMNPRAAERKQAEQQAQEEQEQSEPESDAEGEEVAGE